MSIKGGGVGRLMENSILNFHFVFWITSLTFSALVLIFYILSCSVSGLTRIAQYAHVPILVAIKATRTKCKGKQLKRHITRWRLSSGESGKGRKGAFHWADICTTGDMASDLYGPQFWDDNFQFSFSVVVSCKSSTQLGYFLWKIGTSSLTRPSVMEVSP